MSDSEFHSQQLANITVAKSATTDEHGIQFRIMIIEIIHIVNAVILFTISSSSSDSLKTLIIGIEETHNEVVVELGLEY